MAMRNRYPIDKYGLRPDQYLVSEKNENGKVVSFVWSSYINNSTGFLKNKKTVWSSKQTIQMKQIEQSEFEDKKISLAEKKEALDMCEKAIAPLLSQDTLPVQFKKQELSKEEQKIKDQEFMRRYDQRWGSTGPVMIELSTTEDLKNPDVIEKIQDAKYTGRGYKIASA